jgi:hypothetical protein
LVGTVLTDEAQVADALEGTAETGADPTELIGASTGRGIAASPDRGRNRIADQLQRKNAWGGTQEVARDRAVVDEE